jgi:hypothetical protein
MASLRCTRCRRSDVCFVYDEWTFRIADGPGTEGGSRVSRFDSMIRSSTPTGPGFSPIFVKRHGIVCSSIDTVSPAHPLSRARVKSSSRSRQCSVPTEIRTRSSVMLAVASSAGLSSLCVVVFG